MPTLYESLVSRLPGLSKRLARKNGHVQLPKNVQDYLRKEHSLFLRDMVNFRCVGRRGSFAGAPVNYLRIFNQARARERGIIVQDYRDLDTHRELVLFEGHVFKKDGITHLKKINPVR